MGVPCCRPRKGGFWGKDGQKYKERKQIKSHFRFPPFRILGTPKQKFSFNFSKNFARALSKK